MIAAFENRIGYRFGDGELLERALTHSSAGDRKSARNTDNERLEFLGDRVLGLVIADMLVERFPKSSEGELAPRLNALVRKETCADVAREIALGDIMVMSAGEAQAGGRQKEAILGDACEALIAAIYRDGGLEPARAFIAAHWSQRFDGVRVPPRDPKTVLQEWMQGRKLPPPQYRVADKTGPDHEPEFTVIVELKGYAPESGKAGSKRAAEQLAAEAVLRREGVL